MKDRVGKIVAAALLLALLGVALFHGGAQQKRAKGRALLVGVNQYAHPSVPNTAGAEEDARAAKELIMRQYGFDESEIRMLLGPQATARNIIAEFRRWLIEGTQPGDRVFFHYSGHGSRVKDLNGDEADGYDETIAPYDVTLRGENMIIDDELGQLVAQLSGRLAVLVFDSCHSGTISRGGGAGARTATDLSPRYLPSPEEFARLRSMPGSRGPGGQDELVDYQVQDDKSGSRDLKLVDEKSVGPATGIVVISAAQSGQLAYSMKVEGGISRGALSYVFGEAHQGRVLTLRKAREEVTQRINALHQTGRLKGSQQPAFEIISTMPLEDKPLFGDWTSAPEVALNNPHSRINVSLRARDGRTSYKIGEEISYNVTTNTAGYLYLLVFSEDNKAGCLFPNNEAVENQDNYVAAGTHRVPRAKSFYAQEPVGKDVVIALLSSQKLNLVYGEDYSWNDIFDRLKSEKFFDYVTTRGQTAKKPQSGAPAATLDQVEWQAASLVLYTVR
jgi:hypothetical protein